MEGNVIQTSYIREQSQKNTLRLISILFSASYFLMPQYVGVSLAGFDLTINRMFIVILMICILANAEHAHRFTRLVRQYKYLTPVICFEIVLVYTGALRADVGTIMNATIEFIFLFLLIYVIKYVTGIDLFLKVVRVCSYILCLLGVQEYVTGVNLFHKLQTLDANFSQYIRSGSVRIMGPCGHALAYGLLLLLLLPLSCIDWKNKKINILNDKFLFLLITVNVFLTGSRSSLSLFMLEVVLLFLFSPKKEKKLTILFVFIMIMCVMCLVVFLPNSGISRYIMLQITSIVDTIFGTTFAAAYGAESERLTNSTDYRRVLTKIFFVDYLNPVLGRGVSRHSGFQIDGVNIISIDNFYVAQYIRYAYPGLITYVWFVLKAVLDMLRKWAKTKDGIYAAIFCGVVCYFVNLWWMDSLQTLRYVYALMAIIYVYMLDTDSVEKKRERGKSYESKYIRS